MKQTIYKYAFHHAFDGRENFSYEALNLLFNYLEEYEESTGEDIEFDVIAICCEYEENDYEYIKSNYNLDADLGENDIIEYLEDNTQYIGKTLSGLVYAQF